MTQDHHSHPIDIHVGHLVRAQRRQLRLSQDEVATAIDVSPQQVQKYEQGASRISASKLFALSQCLDVPIGFFYQGRDAFETIPETAAEVDTRAWFLRGDGKNLAKLFETLSPAKRRIILNTVKSLAAL